MSKRNGTFLVSGILALLMVLAACQTAAPPSPTTAPTAAPAAQPTAAPAAHATAAPAAAATAAPAAAASTAGPATGTPIKIGFPWGVTGPASDILGNVSVATHAYFDWLNAHGGVNGHPVVMDEVDTKYQVPLAVDAYKKVKEDGVLGVVLGSTGDTEALSVQINNDKLPTFTTSCDSKWADGTKEPYIYTICSTYEDQMVDALNYIKQTWKGSNPPRIAFAYPDNPFGRAPIAIGKATAQKLGFQVVGEVNVDMAAVDATSQALALKQDNPDFVISQNSTGGASAIVRDGKKSGLAAQFIGLNYAFDEAVVKAAGSAAEGYIGVATTAFPADNLPIVQDIKAKAPNLANSITMRTIQGWSLAMVLTAGLERAGSELTTASFKKGLEAGPIDVEGANPEWNYTATSHEPTNKVVLYQVKNGKIVPISGPISPQ